MSEVYPLNITLIANKKAIKIKFSDKKTYLIKAELLRIESPSAEVQGHGGPKKLILNKKNVNINNMELIGNYALRIIFSDGHNSGLYTWEHLLNFAQNGEKLLSEYYKKLMSRG